MAEREGENEDEGNDADAVVERLTPAEAFDIVGEETRLRVLEVLNDADEALSFGDLRDRVGADDPGGFNYHLQRLTDRFVRDTEEGYRLAPAGRRVVGAILSGAFTKTMDADTVPVDGACTICEGDLEANFDGDHVRVQCAQCEWVNSGPAVPPAILEGWPLDEAPAAAGRWLQRKSLSAKLGVCPNCDGRLDQRLCLPDDPAAPDWFQGFVSVATRVAECRNCGHWWHSVVERAVLVEPAVVAFHHQHGIDVLETPAWELDWPETGLATLVSDDPLRVAVPVTLDDETRTFVVDRSLTVVEEHEGAYPEP